MDFEELDDLLDNDLFEIVENDNVGHNYTIKERRDHFNFWNEKEFFNRFRFSKATVEGVFNNIFMCYY